MEKSNYEKLLLDNLTEMKIQNELLSRSDKDKSKVISKLLIVIVFICLIFSISIFLLEREKTKQFKTMFGAEWEVVGEEKQHIYQELEGDGNATIIKDSDNNTVTNSN